MAPGPNTQQPIAGRHALRLRAEDGAGFGKQPTDWANAEKIEVLELNVDNLKNEVLPNEGPIDRGGTLEKGVGLAHTTANFSFKTYMNGAGLGTGGDPGFRDGEVRARPNGFAQAAAACLGAEPVQVTGDTIAASPAPSVSAVQVTTPASFPTGLQILFILKPNGTVVARPATHDGAGLMTFLFYLEASEVPLAGAVVLGGTLLRRAKNHTETFWAEILGDTKVQHNRTGGCVGKMTIEASGAPATQKVAFEFMVAALEKNFVATRLPHPNNRPKPGAYSRIMLAQLGTVDSWIDTCWHHLMVQVAPTFEANECNLEPDETGIDGWTKVATEEEMKISLKLRQTVDVTTGGFTGPEVLDVYKNVSGTDNQLHLFAQIGNKPGATFCVYQPYGRISDEPNQNDKVGNIGAIGVTTGPAEEADDTNYPHLMIMQQG